MRSSRDKRAIPRCFSISTVSSNSPQRPAEPVEPHDTEHVAVAGVIEQGGKPRSLEGAAADDVVEDADGPGIRKPMALPVQILVRRRYPCVAENVCHASCRLLIGRLWEGCMQDVFLQANASQKLYPFIRLRPFIF